MRDASLQPLPEVETPIWRGPSRCVDNNENVQFEGESAQLIGIRNRLHNKDIQVTSLNSTLFREKKVPFLSRGDRVTNTISTTRSTSSLPRLVKSVSSKSLCICDILSFCTSAFKSKCNSSTSVGDIRIQVAPASSDLIALFAAMPLSPTIKCTCCVQSTEVKSGTGISTAVF